MNSKLYTGHVIHTRTSPRLHKFKYSLFAFYLDLDEMPLLFSKVFWLGSKVWHLFRFNRKDYHRSDIPSLKEAVQQTVFEKTGIKVRGPIRIFTQLRFLGYTFNPVSFYYCYDEADKLRVILAEIENTPWSERYSYAQIVEDSDALNHIQCFQKDFHVSPFMPMDQSYEWQFSTPRETLKVSMSSFEQEESIFNAKLTVRAKPLTTWNLLLCAAKYPFMPQKVSMGIYIQAIKLYCKKVPFFDHPNPQSQMKFSLFFWRNRNV